METNKMETNKIVLEYIWLDAKSKFRSKTRVLEPEVEDTEINIKHIPKWNYDGSSTGQACGYKNTEIILLPVYMCKNPFKNEFQIPSYYVLCATYNIDNTPTATNHYDYAQKVFSNTMVVTDTVAPWYADTAQPWYGLEQEYFIFSKETNDIVGKRGVLEPQGDYYCRMGDDYGKAIAHEHLYLCIEADLDISGLNAEVAPAQWEYQIGPCPAIVGAHQLMVARFILEQVADKHNCYIVLEPKPLLGWNGSGCHINFSTPHMRYGNNHCNGLSHIHLAIQRLESRHAEHMTAYGENNEARMSGECETSAYDVFSWGVGTRNTSIRIGNDVVKNGCGYFEDRRPASNIDPYLAMGKVYETICGTMQ